MKHILVIFLLFLPLFGFSQSTIFTFHDTKTSYVHFGNYSTTRFNTSYNQKSKFYSRIQDILNNQKNLNDSRAIVWGRRLPKNKVTFKKAMRERKRAFKRGF